MENKRYFNSMLDTYALDSRSLESIVGGGAGQSSMGSSNSSGSSKKKKTTYSVEPDNLPGEQQSNWFCARKETDNFAYKACVTTSPFSGTSDGKDNNGAKIGLSYYPLAP